MKLPQAAVKVYENKYNKPESDLAKRCIDFKDMEELALRF